MSYKVILDGREYFYTTTVGTSATGDSSSNGFIGIDPSTPTNKESDFTLSMPTGWMSPPPSLKITSPNYMNHEILVYYPRASAEYKKGSLNHQSPGCIEFINIKDFLARFFVSTHFNLERIKNWRARCIGITSIMDPLRNYGGGDAMPMFDYDGNVKKKIRKDVADLQEQYGLGDAWVYRTKKGYHVYFFCDQVSYEIYIQMLKETNCCEGFKDQTTGVGFGVLRVSAKYTNFDIELEYILKSKNISVVKKPLRKAYIVQELLSLGQHCGTHLASLYPQWAAFKEDPKEWRSPAKPKTRRAHRKSDSKTPLSPTEVLLMKEELEIFTREEEESSQSYASVPKDTNNALGRKVVELQKEDLVTTHGRRPMPWAKHSNYDSRDWGCPDNEDGW